MKKVVWLQKAKTEDLVKGLDELSQNCDVVAAVIFTLIDVKHESGSKQQCSYYFCYDHSLDSGWTFCKGIMSFLDTIVECYHMECSLFMKRPMHHMIQTTENFFELWL